ncbi:MAG: hypothetical protein ACLPYZ_10275 [Limisphaerales bacterium]
MKIIADGDSWASYPKFLLTGGGLIDHLETVMGVEITNFAHPGDSMLETMGLQKSQRLESILPGADILLFSGGGDDIAGDQFCIWLNQNDGSNNVNNAVNWPRLRAAMDLILANYEDLLDIRDRIAPSCLLVTHSYDWPVASKLGVGVLWNMLGPWLKPSLDYCGWTDPQMQVAIIKMVMIEFQDSMADFAAKNRLHLHINTQGTLGEDDWDNEIHANGLGWTKLAKVISAALKTSGISPLAVKHESNE